MDSHLININKMFTFLLCLAFAAHVIRGANQCVQTNTDPSRYCADQCTVQTGCRDSRKKCLCDGDCGYSCIYPTKRCQDPGTPWKGNKRGNLGIGETLWFSCQQCYQLQGSLNRTCRPDLTWSGHQPKCTLRKCIRLRDPINGKITVESNYCGRTAHFECNSGYQLRGSRNITCQNDGTWSAKSPTCVGSSVTPSCSQPFLPPGARILLRSRNMLAIGCKTNYTLLRTGLMQCTGNRWLIFSRVSCSVRGIPRKLVASSCGQPFLPLGARILVRSGNMLAIGCKANYTLLRTGLMQCTGSRWMILSRVSCSGSSVASLCGQPFLPPEARILVRSGNMLAIGCKKNYTLLRTGLMQCTGSRWMIFSRVSCSGKICRDPGPPWNGRRRGKLGVGQTLHFSCYECYKLRGNSTRTCQADRTWSGRQPRCTHTLVRCSTLGHPRRGRILGKYSRRCGDRVVFGCYSGYRLRGAKSITCQSNGKWSAASPTCVHLSEACPDPDVPKDGYKRGASYFIGDVVTFTCDDCYRLVGSSQRTCLKHKSWSGIQPKCVLKTCPPLYDTKQATVSQIQPNSRECNAVATYTCKDKRMTVLGSGNKICNTSGIWEGEEPKCINPNTLALEKSVIMSSRWKLLSGLALGKKIIVDSKEPVSSVIAINGADCCAKKIFGFNVPEGNNADESAKSVG